MELARPDLPDGASPPMRKEAAEAGFFQTKAFANTKYSRLQILAIEELLSGKRIEIPLTEEIHSFFEAHEKADSRNNLTPIRR